MENSDKILPAIFVCSFILVLIIYVSIGIAIGKDQELVKTKKDVGHEELWEVCVDGYVFYFRGVHGVTQVFHENENGVYPLRCDK